MSKNILTVIKDLSSKTNYFTPEQIDLVLEKTPQKKLFYLLKISSLMEIPDYLFFKYINKKNCNELNSDNEKNVIEFVEDSETPLLYVFKNKIYLSEDIIEKMIEGTDVNIKGENGRHALMIAFSRKYVLSDFVWKKLIDKSNLLMSDDDLNTPLMFAFKCQMSFKDQLWLDLIDRSECYNYDYKKRTTLIYAIIYSVDLSEKVWERLIKKSDLKVVCNMGSTALKYALAHKKNFSEKVWDLFFNGSNLQQQTAFNNLAIDYAVMYNVKLHKKYWSMLYDSIDKTDLQCLPDLSGHIVSAIINNGFDNLTNDQIFNIFKKTLKYCDYKKINMSSDDMSFMENYIKNTKNYLKLDKKLQYGNKDCKGLKKI
jgi:hypothetical protein